jgi:hypothetical protein
VQGLGGTGYGGLFSGKGLAVSLKRGQQGVELLADGVE